MVPVALLVDVLLVWVLGLAAMWGLWRIASVGSIYGPNRSTRLMGTVQLALPPPPPLAQSRFDVADPYRPAPLSRTGVEHVRVVSPAVARRAGLRTEYWTVTVDGRYRAGYDSRARALAAAADLQQRIEDRDRDGMPQFNDSRIASTTARAGPLLPWLARSTE